MFRGRALDVELGAVIQRRVIQAREEIYTHRDLKKEFTRVRNSGQHEWLKDVSYQVSANALRDLDKAYKQYQRGKKSRRKVGLPRYKAKGAAIPSFCLNSDTVYIDRSGLVYLEKIGHVRCKYKGALRGIRLWDTRIKFERGKWLLKCFIECDMPSVNVPLRDRALGVDVGVKSLAVVSMSGRKRVFKNINRTHKMRRLVRQLKHRQRALARKQKGSNNRLKERIRVRELYGRIKRLRHDYIQRVTRSIVNMSPKVIVVETLNIQGMTKNRHSARVVSEQNFYLFMKLLETKAGQRETAT